MTLVQMSAQLAPSGGRTGKPQQATALGGATTLDLVGHTGASIWAMYFYGENLDATNELFDMDTPDLATTFSNEQWQVNNGVAAASAVASRATYEWQNVNPAVVGGFAAGWLMGVQPNGEARNPFWWSMMSQEPDDDVAFIIAASQGAAADVGDTLRLTMSFAGDVPAGSVFRTEQGTI